MSDIGWAPEASSQSRFELALSRFNASEQLRTVRSLMRSLGAPSVSVGTLARRAGEIRITVAWEISWYQWGVDVSDEARPIYEIARGKEVAELDASARHWNGHAVEGGELRLGSWR